MIKDWRKYKHYSLSTASMEESIGAAIATKSPDFTADHRTLEKFLEGFVDALQEHYDCTLDVIDHDLLKDDMRYIRTIRVLVHGYGKSNEYYENILLTPLFIY
jgi:hypothetical protein